MHLLKFWNICCSLDLAYGTGNGVLIFFSRRIDAMHQIYLVTVAVDHLNCPERESGRLTTYYKIKVAYTYEIKHKSIVRFY